jgi:hypothetical protein
MALTQAQKTILEKARALSASAQAIPLTDSALAYVIAVIATDLQLQNAFPEFPPAIEPFFGKQPLVERQFAGVDVEAAFERLVGLNADADTYFACLASLHKRRIKYERILQTQAMPTIDQVGPRGLLQFGSLSARALTPLLFWRKWFFDIDNRAGQETGYVFEPIIAAAIGGTPAAAAKSPIRRHREKRKGRQVDCIRGKLAYEFKIRLTIASSGQGRWREELDFPVDCRRSGYVPVLVVLDPTSNPKLSELQARFNDNGGQVYIGEDAWDHLANAAGPTMSTFLTKYVRDPIKSLLAEVPEQLPEFRARVEEGAIILTVGDESLRIQRSGVQISDEDDERIPDDAADELPGP